MPIFNGAFFLGLVTTSVSGLLTNFLLEMNLISGSPGVLSLKPRGRLTKNDLFSESNSDYLRPLINPWFFSGPSNRCQETHVKPQPCTQDDSFIKDRLLVSTDAFKCIQQLLTLTLLKP